MYQQHQQNPLNMHPFIPHKEKIMMIPGILIKQKFDVLEAITGCEVNNKYDIF